MSARARGVPSQSTINIRFPHQVAVRLIGGQEVGVIWSAGNLLSLCRWRHKVFDEKHGYEVFCFSDPVQAAAFRETIMGEVFDARDKVGGRWDRGRGARRDARRPNKG